MREHKGKTQRHWTEAEKQNDKRKKGETKPKGKVKRLRERRAGRKPKRKTMIREKQMTARAQ